MEDRDQSGEGQKFWSIGMGAILIHAESSVCIHSFAYSFIQ